tara:strand:- start:5 stop:2434 length:2430 start_codon:yes stop_codon:yes gene_type:complete
MSTIANDIQYAIGDSSQMSGPEIIEANRAYSDTIRSVVTLACKLNPESAYMFATGTTETTVGNSDLILEVARDDEVCIEIPSRFASKAEDINSIYYATNDSPVYYKKNSEIKILPSGGTAEIQTVQFHDWNITQASGRAQHGNFPENWHVLPHSAACKAILRSRLSAKRFSGASGATYSMPASLSFATASIDIPTYTAATAVDFSGVDTTLSTPSPGTITYNAATGSTESAITVGSLGTAPSWNAVTYVGATALSATALDLSGVTTPTSATLGSTYDAATASAGVTASISSFGTPPEYTSPSFTLVSFPSGSTALNDLDLSSISVPTLTLGTGSYAAYSHSTASATTVGSLGTAPTYTKPGISWFATGSSGEQTHADWQTMTNLIENEEDAELAGAQGRKIQMILQKYQSDLQNETNEFNKENAIYSTTVQEAIQNAQLEQQKALQDAQLATNAAERNAAQEVATEMGNIKNDLQKYAADLQKYQAEVNSAIQVWTQNEFALKYQRWQQENADALQQYQLDLQDKLNAFNDANVEFQADIQKKMSQAQLDQARLLQTQQLSTDVSIRNAAQAAQTELQADQNELSLYSNEIQEYNTEINKLVSQHTQNIQRELTIWQTDTQTALSKYSADINQESKKLEEEIVIYQSTVQKAMSDAQMAHDKAMQDARSATDISKTNAAQEMAKTAKQTEVELGKYQAEVNRWGAQMNKAAQQFAMDQQKASEDYKADSSNYSLELQRIAELNQNEIQRFSLEMNRAVQEWQTITADFNTKMTTESKDIETLQASIAEFSREYNENFNILLGGGKSDDS